MIKQHVHLFYVNVPAQSPENNVVVTFDRSLLQCYYVDFEQAWRTWYIFILLFRKRSQAQDPELLHILRQGIEQGKNN